jgi:hypothetical protein
MDLKAKEATVSRMLDVVNLAQAKSINEYSLCSELYNIVYNDLIVEVALMDLEQYALEVSKNARA